MLLQFRLFDRNSNRMIYPPEARRMGIFIGLDGLPVQYRQAENKLVLLQNVDIMYSTGLLDVNKRTMWTGDRIECDVVLGTDLDGHLTLVRGRGVMSWDVNRGCFHVKLEESPLVKGEGIVIQNPCVVGHIYEQVTSPNHEQSK